ncbi:MAG: GH25 family lysozyme [Pseudomonadota bacterium]
MNGFMRMAAFGGLIALGACTSGDFTSLGPISPLEYEKPQSFPVHGIDVSKYQGDIDWQRAKEAGVKFAFIKATEGGDRFDERFDKNWKEAAAAGIPRSAYHFYYFCRSARDQVRWYIKHVPRDPKALPPVLDMEWNGHSPTCTIKPPRDKVLAEMRVFLNRLESHYGKKPIIYTSVDFHREILEGEFNDYPFWVRSVAGHPRTKYNRRDDWTFWQYTGTGRVDGIVGNVDRNVFGGSRREWNAWRDGNKDAQTAAR